MILNKELLKKILQTYNKQSLVIKGKTNQIHSRLLRLIPKLVLLISN